jgi:hypothetical protein
MLLCSTSSVWLEKKGGAALCRPLRKTHPVAYLVAIASIAGATHSRGMYLSV